MRNPVFDIMKGIGIIFVIVGHRLIPYPLFRFIFSWHMPMFFIISGYFYKQIAPNKLFIKDSKALLLPYFVTALCLFLICIVFNLFGYTHVCGHEFNILNDGIAIFVGAGVADLPVFGKYVVGVPWFLLALFWCKAIYNLIDKINLRYVKMGGVIVCFILPIILIRYIFIPTNLLQGMSAVLFFAFGHFIKQRYNGNIKVDMKLLLLALLVTAIASHFATLTTVRCRYDNIPLNLLTALTGTYSVYAISWYINKSGNRISSFLDKLGQLSILIFCLHSIDLRLYFCDVAVGRLIPYEYRFAGYAFLNLWHLVIPIGLALLIYKNKFIRLICFSNR